MSQGDKETLNFGLFACVPAPLALREAVVQQEYSDAALVLLGHGSTKNADSSAPVYQHAAELRRRKIFAEVREGFWKQPPQVRDVLKSLHHPRVFLVPLFVSEGYFSEQIIPRNLGFADRSEPGLARVKREGERTLFYCKPVGTHPSMTRLLQVRAREVLQRFPAPQHPEPHEIALFIAGHGTRQNENSRKAIEKQADTLGKLGTYAEVHAVFLEEDPRIASCYKIAAAKHIVVVPFFISEGQHAREDIPVMLGAPAEWVRERIEQGQPTWVNPTARNGKLVWYAASAGHEPLLTNVILELVRGAEAGARSTTAA